MIKFGDLFCQFTNLPEICFAQLPRIAFAWGWVAETFFNKHEILSRSQGPITWRQPVLRRGFVDYSKNVTHTQTTHTLNTQTDRHTRLSIESGSLTKKSMATSKTTEWIIATDQNTI